MRRGQEDSHQYDDIINLPCHVSNTRPHMSMLERAAQFSPFAALSGYDDVVKEAMRLTEEQIEPDEDSKEDLDRKLVRLKEYLGARPEVMIVYFQPDARKEGGKYQIVKGRISKIDAYEHRLILEDGMVVPLESIIRMDSPVFQEVEMP